MSKTQIEKIKNGELEELDKIYLEVKPIFISYARKNFSSMKMDDIEDVYQDVIIVFYQNIQRGLLTEITKNISSYIIQIGKMKLIKLFNESNKTESLNSYLVENAVDSNDYNHELDEAIKFIFTKMTEKCKQILKLFYFNKHSMEEIAVSLGYKNADTVKSQKNRCISSFFTNVNNMCGDGE